MMYFNEVLMLYITVFLDKGLQYGNPFRMFTRLKKNKNKKYEFIFKVNLNYPSICFCIFTGGLITSSSSRMFRSLGEITIGDEGAKLRGTLGP